jgi:NAD(P)-dependent dehydrogenase (short-subunit alcohol dehydrogenase family)
MSLIHHCKETTMSQSKIVIITGASSGIGLALAEAFIRRGDRVVGNARNGERLQQAVASFATPDNFEIVAGDIAEPAVGEALVRRAVERFGRVDVLVNNAGIFIAKPFTKHTEEDFASIIATNAAGFFHVTRAAVEAMERQGSGHVVSITTSLVDHANSNVPSVLASLTKGGLNAATRSLAIEYATRGIRFNAVSPGIIKTPMHPESTHAVLSALHPVGHMGEVSDIADAVLYLDSASFVTGEILHVDGGQSAGH